MLKFPETKTVLVERCDGPEELPLALGLMGSH